MSHNRPIGPYRTYAALPGRGFGAEYVATAARSEGAPVRVVVLEGIASAQRKRLKQRLEEAKRLRHPQLESVLDVIESGGSLTVVTERIAGVTLGDLLGRAPGALAAENIAAIVGAAATGIHALHEHAERGKRGLEWIHGHLSPRAIVISWSGRVAVANVGFGELVVTPRQFEYFSPEQARSAPADRKSDVFALGLILYEGLTGSRPFAYGTLPDYMLSVISDQVRDPAELCAGLSPEIGRITMRCLEREPERRFASAGELARALGAGSLDAAALEQGLSSLLAEHFAREKAEDDELRPHPMPAGASFDAARESAKEAPKEPRWMRFRPALLLLIVAVVLLIVAWAKAFRGG